MPKYIVKLPEMWIRDVHVEAETEEKAYAIVQDQLRNGILNLDDGAFDFSHVMQNESWSIENDESE